MPRRMIDEGQPEDTEGNMPLRRGVDSGDTSDDAEGNAIRSGRAAKAGRTDGDDTEGHAVRSGRSVPQDARPNRGTDAKGARPRF